VNSSKTEAVRSFPAFSEWQCSDKISLNGNLSIELHRKVLGQYHNQTFLFTDLEGHTHIKQKTEETSTNKIKSWILLVTNYFSNYTNNILLVLLLSVISMNEFENRFGMET